LPCLMSLIGPPIAVSPASRLTCGQCVSAVLSLFTSTSKNHATPSGLAILSIFSKFSSLSPFPSACDVHRLSPIGLLFVSSFSPFPFRFFPPPNHFCFSGKSRLPDGRLPFPLGFFFTDLEDVNSQPSCPGSLFLTPCFLRVPASMCFLFFLPPPFCSPSLVPFSSAPPFRQLRACFPYFLASSKRLDDSFFPPASPALYRERHMKPLLSAPACFL